MKEAHANKDSAVKSILSSAIKKDSMAFGRATPDNQSEEQTSYNSTRVEGILQNVDPLK